jgi:hypothetical protein
LYDRRISQAVVPGFDPADRGGLVVLREGGESRRVRADAHGERADDEQREEWALDERPRRIAHILPERFHQIASGIEWGNDELATYAKSGWRRDTFSMSGNDLPISGLSRPSSGIEVICCSIRAVGRLIPSIRYFSDACRAAID